MQSILKKAPNKRKISSCNFMQSFAKRNLPRAPASQSQKTSQGRLAMLSTFQTHPN
jgi:hypothetical protein